MIFLFAVAAVTLGLSAFVVGLVREYALRRSILDRPNDRSSHVMPTPRGGGLGLVFVVALGLTFGLWTNRLPPIAIPGFAGLGLLAWVGWMDDRSSLGVRIRLVAHAVASVSLLPLALVGGPVPGFLGWGAVPWWIFCVVSSINVVNFMDGIDGLIGSQLLVFGFHGAILGIAADSSGVFGAVLAGAAAGFLFWNWSPARVFLGDVGSASIGFLVVWAALFLMRETGLGLVTTFLPLYPLFLDAGWTLARRLQRGEDVTKAHRNHLYQRLANGGWGHARVSLLYAGAALLGVAAVNGGGPLGADLLVACYLLLVPLGGIALDRRCRANAVAGGVPDPRSFS